MDSTKAPLLGKTLDELTQIVLDLGMPKFTAGQIASWLYGRKVASIDEMTNLSVKNRERLKECYEVGATAPVHEMRSVDGTVKYLFRTPEGDYVESVYIPDADRATLCVSSQVGCKMNCKFCMTGKQGYTNSGIETFKGTELLDNLAREICQNSLDAKDPDSCEPVTVEFKLTTIQKEDHPFLREYSEYLKGGKSFWQDKNDKRVMQFLDRAEKVIAENEKAQPIEIIDCDYDLGDFFADGGDGIKLLDWLLERNTLYPVALHTMNPVGRENMRRMLQRYWRERG